MIARICISFTVPMQRETLSNKYSTEYLTIFCAGFDVTYSIFVFNDLIQHTSDTHGIFFVVDRIGHYVRSHLFLHELGSNTITRVIFVRRFLPNNFDSILSELIKENEKKMFR